VENFIAQPNADGLVKLSGTIQSLKVTRSSASFVFTESDQTKLGVIAIAAAFAGLDGQAMSNASNASDMEEEADYLQFFINGQTVKGWVWRSPFKNGDVVDVAAEWQSDHYEAFGIARPVDKMIALYPHCSRGKTKHVKNAVKWWLIGGGGVICLFLLAIYYVTRHNPKAHDSDLDFLFSTVIMTFFALVTYSMTRQWMPFARLAEKVFRTLELPNPGNVDLVKSSKTQRTDKDPGEFGTFYFRY
jgi:hypothetical protein